MNELKRLLAYVVRYRVRVGLAILAMLATAAFTVALPVVAKLIIDLELGPANALPAQPTGLAALGNSVFALVVLVFVLRGAASYTGQYLINWVGERVVRDLRDDLATKLTNQSLGFYAEHSTGVVIARVVSDVERIHVAVTEKLYDALSQPFVIVGLMGYVLYKDWRLALVSFVAAPLVVVPVVRFGRKLRKASASSQERMAEVASSLHEIVKGIRVVKAFAMERFEVARFKQATQRLFAANMRAVRVAAVTPPVMEVLAGVGVALAFLYGRTAIHAGRMSLGDVESFFIALFMLYTPLKKLTRVVSAYEQALAAASRVWEIIDQPVAVQDKAGARTIARIKGEIRFERVSFRYEDRWVLEDIDLEINASEVVALVGPSGAGKSTLANLMLRFYDPTRGRLTVDGSDVRDVTLASLREQIALVTQDVVLFNDTVRNNIAYGLTDLPLERVEAAAQAAHAHTFISELPEGYDTPIGEGGVKLSGGQRQRLAIARALLKNAPVLILDEATSSLDAESEVLVADALQNLMRDRTTLIIAHRLQTVRRADRIVVLEAGRIVETGTHAQLLQSEGLYSRLVDLQARGVIAP